MLMGRWMMAWWNIPDDSQEREFLKQRAEEERKAIEDRQSRTKRIAKGLNQFKGNHYADAIRTAMYGPH